MVQGVTVSEIGFTSFLDDHARYACREIGSQVSQVTRLAEMDLQGGHLAVEVDPVKTGSPHQPLKLLQQVKRGRAVHICEIYLRRSHIQ